MNLGLAVSAATRSGVADSKILLAAAATAGVTARLIDWRSTEWDWADAVLLHTPWDYTADPQAFSSWLTASSHRMPVFNPPTRITGNTHKSYLLDLADAGVPLPRTRLLPSGQVVDDGELRTTFGTSPLVVKPAVGAGGRHLCRLDQVADLDTCPLVGADGSPLEDLVIQEFVHSIETVGESSLVMIAGEPSHLIRKVPATGEFRVQASYGGTEQRVEMDAVAHQVAQAVRSHVADLAYARIDYVLDEEGRPLVMELELTEPDLFLRHFPSAANTLIEHVTRNWPPGLP